MKGKNLLLAKVNVMALLLFRKFLFHAGVWFSLTFIISCCSRAVQSDAASKVAGPSPLALSAVDSVQPDFVQPDSVAPHSVASVTPVDTASRRILLVGDSQAGGIMYPLNDYCLHNGHEIAAALVWFSASDRTLAGNDTLPRLIQRYQPDYIIVVIGLNQVFQQYHEGSRAAVKKMISAFGGIPYAWIGPANWVKDEGINDVYAEVTDPETFFRTADLNLDRAGDGRHPNMNGYRQWMDSVAGWLSNSAKWPIRMQRPAKRNLPNTFPLIILNAARPTQKAQVKRTVLDSGRAFGSTRQ